MFVGASSFHNMSLLLFLADDVLTNTRTAMVVVVGADGHTVTTIRHAGSRWRLVICYRKQKSPVAMNDRRMAPPQVVQARIVLPGSLLAGCCKQRGSQGRARGRATHGQPSGAHLPPALPCIIICTHTPRPSPAATPAPARAQSRPPPPRRCWRHPPPPPPPPACSWRT